VAKENAFRLNLTNRIGFIKSDWANLKLKTRFDLVISNPPYITTQDICSLQEDVKNYEPYIALAGGKDGLDCYREIFLNLSNLLKPNGICIFEIGAGQFDEISKIASGEGFKLHQSKKDLSGIIRAVSFELIGEKM
jgi:release factor glutamine methyltransferase